MEFAAIIIVAAVTFGVCFLFDKGFQRIFRNQTQHKTGLSVRLSKKYGAIGLILVALGVGAVFTGLQEGWLLLAGGGFLGAIGLCLVVYYLSFGLFYDETSFLLSSFGKKAKTYAYGEIQSQQLFNSYGNIIIELQMTDGRTVQLQSAMEGVYPFLDKAFAGWCAQRGITQEDCDFYDPQNSCWFPPREEG